MMQINYKTHILWPGGSHVNDPALECISCQGKDFVEMNINKKHIIIQNYAKSKQQGIEEGITGKKKI